MGLWEKIRVRRGHKGGALVVGLVPLWEETPNSWLLSLSLSLSPPYEDMANDKEGPSWESQLVGNLDLEFPVSRTA
jgi:hypothetical protein